MGITQLVEAGPERTPLRSDREDRERNHANRQDPARRPQPQGPSRGRRYAGARLELKRPQESYRGFLVPLLPHARECPQRKHHCESKVDEKAGGVKLLLSHIQDSHAATHRVRDGDEGEEAEDCGHPRPAPRHVGWRDAAGFVRVRLQRTVNSEVLGPFGAAARHLQTPPSPSHQGLSGLARKFAHVSGVRSGGLCRGLGVGLG
jgi:hypothetical protein